MSPTDLKSRITVRHVVRDQLIALSLLAFAACVLTSTLSAANAGTAANPPTLEEEAQRITDGGIPDTKAYIQIIAPSDDEALGTVLYGVGSETSASVPQFGGPR